MLVYLGAAKSSFLRLLGVPNHSRLTEAAVLPLDFICDRLVCLLMSLNAGRRFVVVILLTAGSAFAQIDLGGEWAATFHEDLPHRGGVQLGDYTGLPLNESGWRKAQSWDESARSTFERQCIPHVVTYAMRGPANIRFSKIVDPVSGELTAYSLLGSY